MDIESVKKSYINWIQENTMFTEVLNEAIEVSSPFFDVLNENIKIYIEPNSDKYKITDDGYTMWNLESMGMSFRKGYTREKVLIDTINRSSVNLDSTSKEFYIYSNMKDLGKTVHIMLQTIISITDMIRFNTNKIKDIFSEEVSYYFKNNSEIFDPFPDVEIQGKSKLIYRFDYLMSLRNKEKKLVRLINNLNKTQVESTLISWQDTHDQRKSKYKDEKLSMVALINDKDKELSREYLDALYEYNIEPVGFSDKSLVKKSLSLVG